MNKIMYSVDVESDLHTGKDLGITDGLKKFEEVCDKNKIKPTLFVVASLIEKHKVLFKRLHKKGWYISLHGYSHKRFDDLDYNEKEIEIEKSLEEFRKIGIKPRGFRAPQHSIDKQTLKILEAKGFEYDSSYFPLNLLQLFFFPKRIGNWFKGFFSKLNAYKIEENLIEIPTSSLFVPFVSLTVRILPKWALWIFVKSMKFVYKNPVFYAHSWDFIELKDSRIDRTWGHERFLDKLDYVMSID